MSQSFNFNGKFQYVNEKTTYKCAKAEQITSDNDTGSGKRGYADKAGPGSILDVLRLYSTYLVQEVVVVVGAVLPHLPRLQQVAGAGEGRGP